MPAPRGLSLLARTGLTLALTTVLMAICAVVALDRLVVQPMSERWAADEAGLFELGVRTWRQLPKSARSDFELQLAERHDLIVGADEQTMVPLLEMPNHLRLLRDDLSSRLGVQVELSRTDDLIWLNIPVDGAARPLQPALRLGFSINRRAVEPLTVVPVIVLIGGVFVLLGAFLIVQRLTRSLVRTSAAAVAFGAGRYFEPIPEEGPKELRALARSFNTMAQEITSLMAHRTTFLAGVNHDLRTPLARVRVALELLPEDADPELIARISRNLEEMDELLSVALQYARGAAMERPVRVSLRSVVEPLVPARAALLWTGESDPLLPIAAGALRRVLQNLIANAERHAGEGALEIGVDVQAARLSLAVRDRGPGIPAGRAAEVFQPFVRIDQRARMDALSRTDPLFRAEHQGAAQRASGAAPTGPRTGIRPGGGSGLGLAIVKQLCDAHGWDVQLRNRKGGGTVATVELPLPTGPLR